MSLIGKWKIIDVLKKENKPPINEPLGKLPVDVQASYGSMYVNICLVEGSPSIDGTNGEIRVSGRGTIARYRACGTFITYTSFLCTQWPS